ncbi:MAG: helix-turn-helix domain-containing protein [Myxococcales bacterium]
MAHSQFVAVPNLEPFLVPPVDNLVLMGRTFAFWQSSQRIHGTLMWGRPNEDDVVTMSNIWDTHQRSPFGRDPTLTDIRHLDGLDLLAFERLLITFREKHDEWTVRAGPQAILHAGGLAGAAILGAVQLTGAGYQLAAFDKVGPALAWAARPEFEEDYLQLRASLLGLPDIVRRVRAAIAASDLRSTRAIARSLGLSVRSLQRHLADAGTSIRAERTHHLIHRAEQLLEGTNLDLTAIAAMLGLGSATRLVSLFRSVHGKTPGTFRAERARRDGP